MEIFTIWYYYMTSVEIPMHFIKTFSYALKETSQLFIGNFSTTDNISMSICNSEGRSHDSC
jgi:hypothetical protein